MSILKLRSISLPLVFLYSFLCPYSEVSPVAQVTSTIAPEKRNWELAPPHGGDGVGKVGSWEFAPWENKHFFHFAISRNTED